MLGNWCVTLLVVENRKMYKFTIFNDLKAVRMSMVCFYFIFEGIYSHSIYGYGMMMALWCYFAKSFTLNAKVMFILFFLSFFLQCFLCHSSLLLFFVLLYSGLNKISNHQTNQQNFVIIYFFLINSKNLLKILKVIYAVEIWVVLCTESKKENHYVTMFILKIFFFFLGCCLIRRILLILFYFYHTYIWYAIIHHTQQNM